MIPSRQSPDLRIQVGVLICVAVLCAACSTSTAVPQVGVSAGPEIDTATTSTPVALLQLPTETANDAQKILDEIIVEPAPDVLVEQDPVMTAIPTHAISEAVESLEIEEWASLTETPDSYLDMEVQSIPVSYQTTEAEQPLDILSEIAFSGNQGGGGCAEAPTGTISIVPTYNYPGLADWVYEWNEPVVFDSPGWDHAETVVVSISDAAGNVVEGTQRSELGGAFCRYELDFPGINTPPGEYSLILRGRVATVIQPLTVIAPDSPRVYPIGQKIYLYGFVPQEPVRLLVYRSAPYDTEIDINYSVYRLAAWQPGVTDEKGQLAFEVAKNDVGIRAGAHFFVMSDTSGVIPEFDFVRFRQMGMGVVPPVESLFPVRVKRPTIEDAETLQSLWSFTEYADLLQPGEQEYVVSIPEGAVLWNFTWCAADVELLRQIAQPLNLKFLIDNLPLLDSPDPISYIESAQIALQEKQLGNGWACYLWSTVLSDWPSDRAVRLTIEYTLDAPIFDGVQAYPAGRYRQILQAVPSL